MGVANRGWEGYCPHGTAIFLTWHRPYVALYEVRGPSQHVLLVYIANIDCSKQLASNY